MAVCCCCCCLEGRCLPCCRARWCGQKRHEQLVKPGQTCCRELLRMAMLESAAAADELLAASEVGPRSPAGQESYEHRGSG